MRPPFPSAIPGRSLVGIGVFLALSAVAAGAEDPPVAKAPAPASTPAPALAPAPAARTIRLTRPFPGVGAWGSAHYDLENEGKTPLDSPQVDGQEVFTRDMVEVPGELKVVSPIGAVPAGGRVRVDLGFSGFSQSGEFVTGLTVRSPGLASPRRIPMIVQVADPWFYPWLVIFLGVAAAFGIGRVSERWRPLQENRYRSLRLTGEVESMRRNAQSAAKLTALQAIRDKLELASTKAELSDIAGSKALIDEAEKDFEACRAAEAQQRSRVAEALDALRAQSAALTARNLPAGMVPVRDAIVEGVREAAEALDADQLDRAEALVASARDRLKEIPPPPAGAGPLSAPLAPEPSLELSDPADSLTTDSTVGLVLEGLVGLAREGDEFDWEFGDGATATTKDGARARHRYRAAGAYVVKVSIRRGLGREEIQSFHRRVVIRPTRTERDLASIRREMLMGELLVSAFSLILASLTGLLTLYVSKDSTYGSLQDYLTAFLWGFGIDGTLRGYAGVLRRMTSPNA